MCLRKILFIVIFSFLLAPSYASQYAYQVSFIDKKGSPSVTSASTFLSARALGRRAAQGIALDSTDLPVSPLYIDSIVTLTGGKIHVISKWLNMCVILVTDTTSMPVLRSKAYIRNIKQVAYYSTFLHKGGTTSSLNSNIEHIDQLSKTTGSSQYYGTAAWPQTSQVNGDFLHDHGFKGQGKLIAVIDAGFIGADVHPGLDSLRNAGGFIDVHNFTLATDNVFAYDTHGLSVLSTMAGNMPGTYVGSAPNAHYALYITEDLNSEQPIELANMLAATERADSIGADVVSVSLGYDTFDDPGFNLNFPADVDGKSTVAAKAANMATKKGMLFVASAGNEGTGVPGFGNHVLTPGDADSAITVGAVDYNGSCPSFSGFGPNGAGQTKPDVCLLGVSVSLFGPGSTIVANDGTSFATPQLAGWAACLWQASASGTTPFMIRNAINKSANPYSNTTTQIGYGVPDFRKAFQALGLKDTPQVPNGSHNWVIAEANPFTNNINIAVNLTTADNVDFILTDINGKFIMSIDQPFNAGWNPTITLPVPDVLPSGVYILRAISSHQQQVLKLLKK